MMAAHYQPDHAGMAAYLRSREVRDMLTARARGAAQYAQATAPVETGEYAASIGVENAPLTMSNHDRAAVRVVAEAPYAAAVEFGNARVRAHHTLARTIDMIEHG